MRTLFAQFGLPETIVTDNGTCFLSAEYETFLSRNGIKHLTSAPYHPSSNSLAECAIQLVKRGLKKVTRGSMKSHLAKVLFHYSLTPQTTTGISPSELLLGQRPRSRLDLLKPHTAERVEKKQSQQKERHDSRCKERKLEVGTTVFVRNYHLGDRWLPGVFEQKTTFRVMLTDGRLRQCHQDQVRKHSVDLPCESNTESDSTLPTTVPTEPTSESPTSVESGTDAGGDMSRDTSPELTDSAVEQPSSDSAKTYPSVLEIQLKGINLLVTCYSN